MLEVGCPNSYAIEVPERMNMSLICELRYLELDS